MQGIVSRDTGFVYQIDVCGFRAGKRLFQQAGFFCVVQEFFPLITYGELCGFVQYLLKRKNKGGYDRACARAGCPAPTLDGMWESLRSKVGAGLVPALVRRKKCGSHTFFVI